MKYPIFGCVQSWMLACSRVHVVRSRYVPRRYVRVYIELVYVCIARVQYEIELEAGMA